MSRPAIKPRVANATDVIFTSFPPARSRYAASFHAGRRAQAMPMSQRLACDGGRRVEAQQRLEGVEHLLAMLALELVADRVRDRHVVARLDDAGDHRQEHGVAR